MNPTRFDARPPGCLAALSGGMAWHLGRRDGVKPGLSGRRAARQLPEVWNNRHADAPGALPHKLHTRGDVGRRWSLHSCSMGKTILAAQPDEEVYNIVLERGLARCTERTTTMEPALRQMLAQIRENGYSVDWEENEPGVRCAAASVTETVRHALGALSTSGPSVRITEQNIAEHGVQVVETAHAIIESLRAM